MKSVRSGGFRSFLTISKQGLGGGNSQSAWQGRLASGRIGTGRGRSDLRSGRSDPVAVSVGNNAFKGRRGRSGFLPGNIIGSKVLLKGRSSADSIGVRSARLSSCNRLPGASRPHSFRLLSRVKTRLPQFPGVKIKSFIVVGTLRNLLRIRALSINSSARASVENSTKRTSIFPGNSTNAQEVLSAVSRVGVLREGSGSSSSRTGELSALFINNNLRSRALRNLIGPSATSGDLVIGKTRGAVVLVGLAIHALPENPTVLRVSECSIEPGAVLG